MSGVFLRRPLLFSIVLSVVLLCGFSSAAATHETLTDRLVEFGLQIEAQIETARYNVKLGILDRSMLTRQAEEANRVLDGLERQLGRLPDGPTESLSRKFEAIRSQVENLNRAAELGSAPPRSSSPDAPAKYVGRVENQRSAPANDDCEDAIQVGLGTFYGDTSEATNDGEAICGSSLTTADVWYRFVSPEYGMYMIDTIGSSFDTVISVHQDCPGTMTNQIVCNDDYVGLQSMVKFTAYQGNEYLIRVSGSNGAVGPYQLTISQGGVIEGTVTQTATGVPISTRVEVFDGDSYQVGYDYTDSAGEYVVGGIVTGNYFVATDGYVDAVDEIYDDYPCPGGVPYGCDATDGDPVAVSVGMTTSGIDFVLDAGATITGVVISEGTGLPVDGAQVRLYNDSGSSLAHTYTDVSGVYAFENRGGGTYFVVARSSLFRDELFDDIPCPGGPPFGCSVVDGTAVVAQIGATTSGIDFSLEELGVITGTVIDRTTGLGLAYADVKVYNSQGYSIAYPDADSNGNYVAGGLENGTYYVAAYRSYDYVAQVYDGIDCPASGCNVLAGTPVVIDDLATVGGIDFDLIQRGAISGQVLDAVSSQPVPSLLVRLYNGSGTSVSYDYTDSGGFYEIDRLISGIYYVATDDTEYVNQLYDGLPCPSGCDPTTGTPVPVVNGQTTTGIDFAVVAEGRISGFVSASNGSGPVTMRMEIYDINGVYMGYDYSNSGEYEFIGLTDGQYYVVADSYSYSYPYLEQLYAGVACWGGYPGGCDLTDGTPVVAAVGTATVGIDFVLKAKGRISGTVRDAVDQSAVSGTVHIRSVDGTIQTYDGLSSGIYDVSWLIPGNYLVIADGSYHRDEVWQDIPCAGEYPDHCDVSSGTPVSVSTGAQITIDMSLDRLGKVNGTVQSADGGLPLSSFYVRLYDEHGDQRAYDSSNYSGEYEFWGLWPGNYFIATDENSINYVDQLHDGIDCPGGPPTGCDPTTGTPVSVDLNTVADVDFNLERTSMITGRVRDAQTGLPLYGINVEAWDSDGDYRRYDSTDSSGYYEVRGLESGTFFIATDEYSSYNMMYIDMLYDEIPCPTGPPAGCDPTKGTPVTVVQGVSTRFIDLALPRRNSGIAGIVTDHQTGQPAAGIQIDLWDVDTGSYAAGTITNAAGTYVTDVDEGNYVVATDNNGGWINQIWDAIECPAGSAYNGDCDPMTGDAVIVTGNELTVDIDFTLRQAVGIFNDGFESGSTDHWSATVN